MYIIQIYTLNTIKLLVTTYQFSQIKIRCLFATQYPKEGHVGGQHFFTDETASSKS